MRKNYLPEFKENQDENTLEYSDHFFWCTKCDNPVYDIICRCEGANEMDNDSKFRALQAAVLRTNNYLLRIGFKEDNLLSLRERD